MGRGEENENKKLIAVVKMVNFWRNHRTKIYGAQAYKIIGSLSKYFVVRS